MPAEVCQMAILASKVFKVPLITLCKIRSLFLHMFRISDYKSKSAEHVSTIIFYVRDVIGLLPAVKLHCGQLAAV